MESLGVLDDEVGPMLVGNRLSERRLDLARNVKVVEDGQFALVSLDDVGPVGCDEFHVVAYLLEDVFIVDIDVLVGRVEEVAQQSHRAACLLCHQYGEVLGLHALAHGLLPLSYQNLHLVVQFLDALFLGDGTDNDAEALGLDALDDLFEPCPFLARLDFARHIDLVTERHQHEVATREGELAGEARSLGADGFLDNLYQYLLSQLQGVLHAAVLGQVRLSRHLAYGEEVFAVVQHTLQVFLLRVELQSQIEIMKKRVAFVADVHKAGIQARHQFTHLGQIDIAHAEGGTLAFFLVFHQTLVFRKRDGNLLGLYVDEYFACHFSN